MSALDSLISTAGEASLLSGMDYSVIPSSSAVVDRKTHVRAYPTSASSLTPTSRTCRIRLGGSNMIESGSVRLMFTINNLSLTTSLIPLGGPWCAWGLVRLLSGGTEIENINLYGRHHELFSWKLLPFQDQWAEANVTGLHGSFDGTNGLLKQSEPYVGKIEAGEKVTVIHKLNLSMFNSKKILPMAFCPLDLEVTMADVTDWLDTTAGTSNLSISGLQIMYTEVIPDEAISNSLYKSLMANRILSVPTLCAFQLSYTVPIGSTSYDCTVGRAFSKLSSIWVTFSTNTARNTNFRCPAVTASTLGSVPNLDDANWCPTARLAIGGKNFPDPQPVANLAEHYLQMVDALGYSPNISRDAYSTKSFCLAFDLRKVPGDHGTAISTRSGDLVRIQITNLAPETFTYQIHITMWAYSVVAIRESGVTLLN